jgi:hypothetical protein
VGPRGAGGGGRPDGAAEAAAGQDGCSPPSTCPARPDLPLAAGYLAGRPVAPLLTGLRASHEALDAARPALDQALAAVGPPAPDAAVRRAALAAGRAGAELRVALEARRGLPPPSIELLAHPPVLRPGASTRLSGV